MKASIRVFLLMIILILTGISSSWSQVSFGEVRLINKDWKFRKGDVPQASELSYDDSSWRHIHLPHDWSVEGPYSPDLASCTGYLPGGIGWYRKSIDIPDTKKTRGYIYTSREFTATVRYS